MNFSVLSTPQRVSAISIGIVIISAFLPWVSILGISKLGIEGDGVITLVLAIAGAIVLFVSTGVLGHQRTPGKVSTWALVILAVLVALVGLLDMNGAAALGLYLTFFAGIGWVVGAIWHLNANKAQAEPTSDQA